MSPRAISRAGGLARRLLGNGAPEPLPVAPGLDRDGPFDAWLSLFDDELRAIDGRCDSSDPHSYALFRELDDDLWTVLLSLDYGRYPRIRALLPLLPDPSLQWRWNGATGLMLLNQGKAFYRKARDGFVRHQGRSLHDTRVLDFGCGWGRLTRFFARDVEPGRLYGCDPVEEILDVCRTSRIPARLAPSEPIPERLPFEPGFGLVFAFSVFTHLSEDAHWACLQAIHGGLAPGGMLVVTIRSPAYLQGHELGRDLVAALDEDPIEAFERPRFLFAAHSPDPEHPQNHGGDMTYGETVISLPYVRERWGELFELLDVALLAEDLHQVVLTLRRRD
jgi:SAM-dependent methyltransferase